jgi:hypothetical protein
LVESSFTGALGMEGDPYHRVRGVEKGTAARVREQARRESAGGPVPTAVLEGKDTVAEWARVYP